MSRKISEGSESSLQSDEGGIIKRLGEIPVVNSAWSMASSSYSKVKDSNAMAKLGLSLAELSIKTALKTTKFAYNVIPKPEIIEKMSDEVGETVSQVDAFACHGLDAIQQAFPYVMTDTDKIISSGTETLEKSEVLEAALILSEAAIDYIQPVKPSKMETHIRIPYPVSNKKVDRMIDVSRRTGRLVYEGSSKAFWGVASVPWNVTKAGYNVVTGAMSHMPGISGITGGRQKVRRSTRRRVKTRPEDVLSFPSAASPEKKRKRSNGDSESDSGELFELIYVEHAYESGDDPDYCPGCDPTAQRSSDSESSDTVEGSEEDEEEGGSEDEDSGEGDEADTSTYGGKSLTPEELNKSPKDNKDSAESSTKVVRQNPREFAQQKKKGAESTEKNTDVFNVKSNTRKVTVGNLEKSKSNEEKSQRNSKSPKTQKSFANVIVGKEKAEVQEDVAKDSNRSKSSTPMKSPPKLSTAGKIPKATTMGKAKAKSPNTQQKEGNKDGGLRATAGTYHTVDSTKERIIL